MGRRRLNLKAAAAELGVTTEAVRKRASRGTLDSETGEDGRLYMWVDDGFPTGGTDREGVAAHLASLEDQVSFLRSELVTRNEELRRNDHIIAALTERIPELEAPSEPRDGPETAPKTTAGRRRRRGGIGGPPRRSSWWQRVFGR